MRPSGEIRQALLQAAGELTFQEDGRQRGPTLQEMAAKAQVGVRAALMTVKNMTRAGALQAIGERKVDYRNKPVAEYAPVPPESRAAPSHAEVSRVLSLWVQR